MTPADGQKPLRASLRRGLYLILTEPRDGYEALCRWAVEAGLPAVQLRYKGHDEHEHLALAHALRRITAGTGTLFIVNDRPDIALISHADGMHLGQDDLPAAEVHYSSARPCCWVFPRITWSRSQPRMPHQWITSVLGPCSLPIQRSGLIQ
ncbi:MAG: thiamine phosphate synthase [Smithella sp.]